MNTRLARDPFGQLPDGRRVDVITLINRSEIQVRIITYGGTVISIRTPDRDGRTDDVTLGFDTLREYVDQPSYIGALIGRYANRIAGGTFALDGRPYRLAINDEPNHLHGGKRGWNRVLWTAEPFELPDSAGVELSYESPDGEEGYPGTVLASVTYTLNDGNELILEYHATTDRPTVLNMTQHNYFNLAGAANGEVLGHYVTINADRYLPIDSVMIPVGELATVEHTPFDFQKPRLIGQDIEAPNSQILAADGYDHCFVLVREGMRRQRASRVVEPVYGRTLEVETTAPGVQFYTGNRLKGSLVGRDGVRYNRRTGFCLEPGHFPDSPNQPNFPSAVLRPGDVYRSRTLFRFGVSGRTPRG